jgi:HlyD family secretion protein
MNKKGRGWLKWIVVLVIILGSALWIMQGMGKGLPVRAEQARTGSVSTWVEERARTTLPRTHTLSMPVTGRILAIDLEEGDSVTKGQILARLDTAELQALVASAQARLALNTFDALEQTALQEFEKWIATLTDTAAAARKVVEANEAKLKYSEWYAKSVEKLFKSGATPEERLLGAQTDNAQNTVDLAVSQLTAQAADSIKLASELGPRYVHNWLERKSLERDALQAELHKARLDLERAVITAPIDGVVLKRYVENERALAAGEPLLEIGNLAVMEITADILSQEAAPIRKRQEVDIHGAVFGDAPLKGVVQRIKPKAFTKVSSLGVEQQRVPVIVEFSPEALGQVAKQASLLGLGYRLRVRIYTDRADDAVIVPRMALFRDSDNAWNLFTVQNGVARQTSVQVGLLNDDEAQIIKGVAEGETIIVSPPKELRDGDTVRLE